MPIVTTIVLSMFLLTVTSCATSSAPPATKQEMGKKSSTKKPIKHDEMRSMNEESMEAVR